MLCCGWMLFIELSLHNKHPFYWPDHLIILIIKALLSLCQKLVHLEKTTWASTVLETKINILRFFVLKRWFSRCPILSSTTIGLDYGILHSKMKCTHQGEKEYTLKPVIINIICRAVGPWIIPYLWQFDLLELMPENMRINRQRYCLNFQSFISWR